MADWRQIQARIRKAKNSPDALAKLSELYQRTRDAMVAWELGAIEEKAGHNDEAGKWYTIAAQRFRRADWKKKAEEALTRLGVELTPAAPTAETSAPAPIPFSAEERAESSEVSADDEVPQQQPLALGEISETHESAAQAPQPGTMSEQATGKRKRRRGRRGGRGRRRGSAGVSPGLPAQAFAERSESKPAIPPSPAAERNPVTEMPAPERRPAPIQMAAPQLPSERAAHGRGDPGLASRMAHLESLLRRLLTSPLHRLDQADEAPAGPGVFLLSDSDQTSSYYIEACQTLRIGLGNLVRGGRGKGSRGGGRFGETDLRSKLAEHLGINEAKVAQYMKDHCVVRWIQLDDEAPLLAHFAIGVLRTPLNLD